uniref:Apoptotic chromatin condensation inducer in the nucleus isoform X2 n=1 Tax=Geotrypetes seraphini TaxID=260995 RepID=A0A6P8P963_GEOSA|nr:apoptotic chromatin condensation inducer in the nucleus isoform X2 [Geotrypetes seraphini]
MISLALNALMLENLQKHSTPHSGLQPNSQIGEEMSQNSFIKQYLEKQQELLRQRLEREAREAAETEENVHAASSEKEDSEDECRSPWVQQATAQKALTEDEREPLLRPQRSKLEWDVKLAEEKEDEEEEEEDSEQEEEQKVVRAPAVARKPSDEQRKKPVAGSSPSPAQLMEGEEPAFREERVPALMTKEALQDQYAPSVESTKGMTPPRDKPSPIKEKAEDLPPLQGSCFHILEKTGRWASVVAYPVSAKAGRKPPTPIQPYMPVSLCEVTETIKRPLAPDCKVQGRTVFLGPGDQEPQHEKQRQEYSVPTDTQRDESLNPAGQNVECKRHDMESLGTMIHDLEHEVKKQDSPGSAGQDPPSERQQEVSPDPEGQDPESERQKQESLGRVVTESEVLRQESTGLAESKTSRLESPVPALEDSEIPTEKDPELKRQREASPDLSAEAQYQNPAIQDPESDTQRLGSPKPAFQDPESGPAVEDLQSEMQEKRFSSPIIQDPETLRLESLNSEVAENCNLSNDQSRMEDLMPTGLPGVSEMTQLQAGAMQVLELHSNECGQDRNPENPVEMPFQRIASHSPSSPCQRRTSSSSSRSSVSSRSSCRSRSRMRSRSRSRSDSGSSSRSSSTSSFSPRTRQRSRSSSRSYSRSRSRSSSNSTKKSHSPLPCRDFLSRGNITVHEHSPAAIESTPACSPPHKPPRLRRNRWNVGPEQNTVTTELLNQQQETQRPAEQETDILHLDSEQEVVVPHASGTAGNATVFVVQKVPEPRKSRDNVEEEAAMDAEETKAEVEGAPELEMRDAAASEPSEAAPPSEEDEKKESTTPKAFKRKISVVSANKGTNQLSTCTAGNSDSETGHPTRKRRWGASTATTQKKPSISITTESLKSLIPDIKPLTGEAVVDLHADEVHMSEDESERNGGESPPDKGLKICRTVTQIVPAETQENGQGEEEEKEPEEEPMPAPLPAPAPAPQAPEVSVKPELPPPVEPEVKKVTLSDTLLRRSISRQKAGVSITIDDPVRITQAPSPPRGKVSKIVHICNLVRPFTLGQLKELLGRTGTLVEENFWIDKIKSHCYATYSTVEEALTTRNALHGVKWPQSNPKFLSADFAEQDELDFHRGLLVNRPTELKVEELPRLHGPRVPHAHPHAPSLRAEHREQERTVREQWAEREREMERRERTRAEREWDRDKIRESGRSRSRSRDRRRKERAKSKDKKSEKKSEKREKVQEEPPAKLLDDLFRKTKTAPCIYWLPLTDEQSARKVAERAERAKEREKRHKEQQDQEEERKGRAKEREKEAERERNRDREKRHEQSRERGRERERRDTKHHSRSLSRSTPVRDRGGRR